MKLSDIMTRNVNVVHPDATIREAAEKMKAHDIGVLPVCDGEKIKGMITDRDIVIRAVGMGKDTRKAPVREAMTRDVAYCFEDEEVADAARVMKEKQIRRLLVLDRDKKLVGLISLGDLSRQGDDERLSGEVVRSVSEPSDADALH